MRGLKGRRSERLREKKVVLVYALDIRQLSSSFDLVLRARELEIKIHDTADTTSHCQIHFQGKQRTYIDNLVFRGP